MSFNNIQFKILKLLFIIFISFITVKFLPVENIFSLSNNNIDIKLISYDSEYVCQSKSNIKAKLYKLNNDNRTLIGETTTQMNVNNAIWNEKFTFSIQNEEKLQVRIFDIKKRNSNSRRNYNQFSLETFIGEVFINFNKSGTYDILNAYNGTEKCIYEKEFTIGDSIKLGHINVDISINHSRLKSEIKFNESDLYKDKFQKLTEKINSMDNYWEVENLESIANQIDIDRLNEDSKWYKHLGTGQGFLEWLINEIPLDTIDKGKMEHVEKGYNWLGNDYKYLNKAKNQYRNEISKVKNRQINTKIEIRSKLKKIIEEMDIFKQAKVKQDPRGIIIEFDNSICFGAGSTALRPEIRRILNRVFDDLYHPTDLRPILIEGHSDNQNPIASSAIWKKYPTNWHLSTMRAVQVTQYLIKIGINPARLVPAGYADQWPTNATYADRKSGKINKSYIDQANVTAKDRQENRRITIVFQMN